MSVVEENIYHLLNQVPQIPSTSPSRSNCHYRSIFASDVARTQDHHKHSHRTMGPAEVKKPDPCNPLRRRQNYRELPEVVPLVRPHRLPPIPKVDQHQIHLSKPTKNFIGENIRKIRNSSPTCPRRYIVSDRKGNKYLIDGSGLQKDFIFKKNYGKVPSYLHMRQRSNEPPIEKPSEDRMILLPAEERLSLIHNLKCRYEEVFAEYQRLPLRPETTSTLLKKTYLTEALVDLERDIDLLEKHQQIFIVNNYSDLQQLQKTCSTKNH